MDCVDSLNFMAQDLPQLRSSAKTEDTYSPPQTRINAAMLRAEAYPLGTGAFIWL